MARTKKKKISSTNMAAFIREQRELTMPYDDQVMAALIELLEEAFRNRTALPGLREIADKIKLSYDVVHKATRKMEETGKLVNVSASVQKLYVPNDPAYTEGL